MKIYNKNKHAKQGKLENVQDKEKSGNKKWNRGKSCVKEGKQIMEGLILNGIKLVVTSWASNLLKGIKQSLKLGVVVYKFNHSTPKAEAGDQEQPRLHGETLF